MIDKFEQSVHRCCKIMEYDSDVKAIHERMHEFSNEDMYLVHKAAEIRMRYKYVEGLGNLGEDIEAEMWYRRNV